MRVRHVLVALLAAGLTVSSAPPLRATEAAPTRSATAVHAAPGAPLLLAAPARPRISVNAPGPAGSKRGTGKRAVALTFDDGPDPVYTPKLLDVLKAHRVKATFCVVGHRVRDNKKLVARIAREGHTLCNHSWQHLHDLGKRPDKYLLRDLEATNEQIRKAVPGAKIKYFRAPYGNFSWRLNGFAKQLGMTPIYWDVDDQCYLTKKYGNGTRMVNHMVTTVQRNTRRGSIVLGHDNLKPTTIRAYRILLPWLKKRFTLIALPA
jgi:peptidoglycan/xylan/chitin deacetylase (PgdA/CDA1 family)